MKSRDEWGTRLTNWYAKSHRDLPWRKTCDPYAIWVSEVMLQQTQVATVVSYFEKWMARFPTVQSLAESTEAQVLEIWQGLGYYRRAKLLRSGAQWVAENGLPKTYQEWLKVPGVGPYTAAAISSISQKFPAAVVDGNVERVFARLRTNSSVGPQLQKAARNWAADVLDTCNPGDWNQALMELGATICTPKTPKCEICPVAKSCLARQSGSVEQYPQRPPQPKVVRESHLVWVPLFEDRLGVRQIPDGQWWGGLWEFPRSSLAMDLAEAELKSLVGGGRLESLGLIRHQVTHHRIVIAASLHRGGPPSSNLTWLSLEELRQLPMPSPQRRVLERTLQALRLEI